MLEGDLVVVDQIVSARQQCSPEGADHLSYTEVTSTVEFGFPVALGEFDQA